MVKPTKEEIITAVADKENKRNLLLALFRKMNRVELLEFEDEEPEELGFNWDIFYEALYEHDWPFRSREQPKYIVPQERAEKWKSMGDSAKDEIETFLNTLNRVELMIFEDSKQFDGIKGTEDAIWEAIDQALWNRDWPMGEHEYKERIPNIVTDTINGYSDLQQQVKGIQKKLDRIVQFLDMFEVKISIKDALELSK